MVWLIVAIMLSLLTLRSSVSTIFFPSSVFTVALLGEAIFGILGCHVGR